MSKGTKMARLPGLFQRDGIHYLRTVIPLDLQATYGTTKRVQSLQTRDSQTAKVAGTALRAELLGEFARKRRELRPSPVDTITPELAGILSARVYATLMGADDTARNNPEAAQMLIALDRAVWQRTAASLRIGPDVRGPLPLPAMGTQWDGLSAEQARELAGINASMDTHAAGLLARQAIGAMLPLLRAEAAHLGLTFTDTAPGTVEALRAALAAYRRAMQDRAARDRGEAIATPEAPSLSALPPKRHTLRDVFERWKLSKPRTADTTSACGRAIVLFEECLTTRAIADLTRAEGDEFQGWLQRQGTTSKTAKDRFTWIKSLLKYAANELGWINKSLWTGLDIKSRTTNRRKPWTELELQTLFSTPLFSEYRLPTAPKAGADAAYWIPLLCIFTGARISELCQLRTGDIETTGRIPQLSITDNPEYSQQTKNEGSIRAIPVHSQLIRLGFLQFVDANTRAGHDRLFPSLRLRKGKPGSYFSTWFGISKPQGLPDLHSFRHLVRSTMNEAGQKDSDMDRVMGHEVRGSEGTRTYTHVTNAVRRTVESIQYPRLTLKLVYSLDRPIAPPKPKRVSRII